MTQKRFVALKPPLKPTYGVDVVANDAAAAKAREAIRNSFLASEDALQRAQGSPTQEQPTRSRLSKRLLQFPQNVPSGRSVPSHYIIFDRIKLSPGTGSEGDKSITLQNKTKTSIAQISLYMPASVDVAYKADYVPDAVGVGTELGSTIADKIREKGVAGAGKALAAASGNQSAPRVGDDGGNPIADLSTRGILKLASLLPGGESADKVAELKTNKVVTDKMELFFKGIGRRSFQYQFTFIPTSKEESKVVNRIINEFKSAMLPEYSGFDLTAIPGVGNTEAVNKISSAISDRTLTVPDLFDIKYMYLDEKYSARENRYLNKITTCYLTDMSVKYGSDRYTAYRPDDIGAPPQNTSVTLNFQEVEIVTRERAAKGF